MPVGTGNHRNDRVKQVINNKESGREAAFLMQEKRAAK